VRSRPRPQAEVERSVRDGLYGERSEVRATPRPGHRRDPRAAGPLGRLVGGRYRLLELVGAGGMGAVFRARDERLARDVAVKLIAERRAREPGFVRRFRREAQLCARLAHPNIVAILDAGVTPRDFIVMELVQGLDAGTLLRREGRPTPGEAVHVVAQVCEALAYAHGHDVVHQDVTLGNILISRPDWTVKLADFGLASDPLDSPGRADAGTPGYVAPEVLYGATPSPRSDLYSLGVAAHALLAGRARGRQADPESTMPLATAAVRCAPLAQARPGLPGRLTEAVERAVAEDPAARQESVAELRAELVGALRAPVRQRPDAAPLTTAVPGELPSAA
jgi:eukaryotic-like serine/threonine-protein kinase